MAEFEAGFVHQFVPAPAPADGITLLLLHGTGGDERDLLPLGRELMPHAALLSPRGRILEQGMPRFFRRFAEGVFDVEDLKVQTHALDAFVRAAAEHYGTVANRIVAVGYSNGANIAASVLLLHPRLLAGAVLFRAMVPFTPDDPPDLRGADIFMASGARDPIILPQNAQALKRLFESCGAQVETHVHSGGHELGKDDVAAAKTWLARHFARAAA